MVASLETYCTAAVCVSLLLWQDAMPTTKFPSVDELLRIELGRVLGCKHVRNKYRLGFSPFTAAQLHAEPWHVEPRELMASFKRDVRASLASRQNASSCVEDVGGELVRYAHEDRFMIPPKVRLLQAPSHPALQRLVTGVAKALQTEEEDGGLVDTDTAQKMVYDAYTAIHSTLVLAPVMHSPLAQ